MNIGMYTRISGIYCFPLDQDPSGLTDRDAYGAANAIDNVLQVQEAMVLYAV
jgi:hypothetical protein